MDGVFNEFRKGYNEQNGYVIANTLLPISSPTQPGRRDNFYRSSNHAHVKRTIENEVFSVASLTDKEGNEWVEVYHAYWTAVGEILSAEKATKAGSQVRPSLQIHSWLFLFTSRIRNRNTMSNGAYR